MTNFLKNSVKKNDLILYYRENTLILASATAKTSVYWISFKYSFKSIFIIIYYFSPPYRIRCFEFMIYKL